MLKPSPGSGPHRPCSADQDHASPRPSSCPALLAAGLLSLRTLVFKLMSVTCSMAGGLIAGKEGPFVHTGGIVGGGWAGMGSRTLTMTLNKLRWYRKPVKVPRKYGGYFRNDADHRDFVSIGTAAGEQLVPTVAAVSVMTVRVRLSVFRRRSFSPKRCSEAWCSGALARMGGRLLR